ncbi:MAG: FAD-dependent monooxygenase [Rhodospirillaceae bacterium]
MDIEQLRTAVLIAGGGPAGLTMAIELGRAGVASILVNDMPDTAQHPKANAIGARTMEHLRRLGCADAVRRCGLADDHPTDVAYFTAVDGYELARLHMPSRADALRLAREGRGPWPSPEPPHRCSQIFLERALKARAATFPSVDLRFGWRLADWRDTGEGIEATVEEVATGRRLAVAARYLAGCDGGRSVVRAQLGIDYAGESGVVRPFLGGSMLGIYFRAPDPPSWLKLGASWQYWIANPRVRCILIHVDDGDRFLAHVGIPPDADPADVARRQLVALIGEAAGARAEIISAVPWTAGYALAAQSYGAGNAFIAGDAAHLFTPTGGLGMNTGVDDAVNLGWKLAALCNGWGGARLAASYEAERRPVGVRNVEFARGFAASVGGVTVTPEIERDTEAGRAERTAVGAHLADHAYREFIIPGIQLGLRYDGSPIVAAGSGGPPPHHHPNRYVQDAYPGGRAPHLWLDEGVALFDRFGPGFTLLRLEGARDDDAATIADAAARRGVPLAVLPVAGAAARDLYGAALALVRPDHHVAWRADRAPADPLALIDTVRGA